MENQVVLGTGRADGDADAKAGLLSSIPLGRAGTVREAAGTVAYLASPAAGYVTGHILSINGGTDA
jgi:NAD(P)-dependent dehydrogenase (short-subunit alcohol dehydrogenase family)